MALTEDDFLDLLDKLIALRHQVKLAETAIEGPTRGRRSGPVTRLCASMVSDSCSAQLA